MRRIRIETDAPPLQRRPSPLRDALLALKPGENFGRDGARSTVYALIAYLKATEQISPDAQFCVVKDATEIYKWRVGRLN